MTTTTPLRLENVPNAQIQQDSLTNERRFLALLFKGKEYLERALSDGITHEFFLNYMQAQIFGAMATYYADHRALLGGDTYEAILRQRVQTVEEVSKWMDEYHSTIRQIVSDDDFDFLSQSLKNNHAGRLVYTLSKRYLDTSLKATSNQGELLKEFQQAIAGITSPTVTLPVARTLDQFSHGDDNGGNLLGNRFLCRGAGLMLAAPTGIGKSVWGLQAGVCWALGQPFLGIKPTGPLSVLVIQAENDDGDVTEIRDGIFAGLSLDTEQTAAAISRIKIVCETCKTGDGFVELVSALVALHRPDLLLIDPFFSYLGDDVCNQKAVSLFLRNGINPILQKHRCGLLLVHHFNKPKSEKTDWRAGDFAYLGSGTGEIANWARAAIAIQNVGEHDTFKMIFGKRGKRSGLTDEWGQRIFETFIRHSDTGICWHIGGEPKGEKRFSKIDLLNLIPAEPIGSARLFNLATDAGCGEKRYRGLLRELIEDESVQSIETPRPGIRPAISYQRVAGGNVTGNEKGLPVSQTEETGRRTPPVNGGTSSTYRHHQQPNGDTTSDALLPADLTGNGNRPALFRDNNHE